MKATKATAKQSLHKGQEYISINPLSQVHLNISWQCVNNACWVHVFLPMLTPSLYISDHLFTDWTWGSSKLIKTIQTAFYLSFTNISYVLSLSDGIVKGVCLIDPYYADSLTFLMRFGRHMTE